jgi:hypothetical protein
MLKTGQRKSAVATYFVFEMVYLQKGFVDGNLECEFCTSILDAGAVTCRSSFIAKI